MSIQRKLLTTRKLEIALALFLIGALLYSCTLLKSQQQPSTKIPVLHPLMQGLYESCPLEDGTECLHHLDQMASSGFTLVLNYDQLYGSAEQQTAYAKKAQQLGMKIIWGMSDPAFWNGTYLPGYFKTLARTCACADNTSFIRYVVHLVQAFPGTWGYYIGDEVKSGDHDRFKLFSDLIKQLDPTHPRLYISGEDTSSMGANLKPFTDSADFVGSDIYPISTSQSIETAGVVSHAIQAVADQSHKPSVMTLQAFSWSEYPNDAWVCSPFPYCTHFPSRDEMLHMRDLVMNNAHPQILLWYSYFDIFRSDNPTVHWNNLVSAMSTPISTVHS